MLQRSTGKASRTYNAPRTCQIRQAPPVLYKKDVASRALSCMTVSRRALSFKGLWLPLQVSHTLAVSHNKLGDLCYTQGDLHEARECYRAALDTRRRACARAGAGTTMVNDCIGSVEKVRHDIHC